jgi:thiol-disulfide isomerase/thioredoxin
MSSRVAILILALVTAAHAGIVDDVRAAVAQNNFSIAESEIRSYQAQNGSTPELAEAISWMARAALDIQQLGTAEQYAKQARALVVQQLKMRRLDSEPHLPLALGSALEVQAQILAAQRKRPQAITLLQTAIRTYSTTSIKARLQKNLNLLSLVGRPAPPLSEAQFLGSKPRPLAQLKGSPVLLFFWAHWCGDCKYEGPIITRLRSEYSGRGLTVIAPTQYYGYAAQGQDATPKAELAWIDTVRQRFYSGLLDVPVPVSKSNFDNYGASTTPTLVLIDRQGAVALYHPGLMSYEDLRSALDKTVN